MIYDHLILGRDPAGIQTALAARRLNRRVAIILPSQPGVDVADRYATLTIQEQQLIVQEVLDRMTLLSEVPARENGRAESRWQTIRRWIAGIMDREQFVWNSLLEKSGCDLVQGTCQVESASRVMVQSSEGPTLWHSRSIILATGTRIASSPHVPSDGRGILSADEILRWTQLPRAIVIAGAGRSGLLAAQLLAACGVQVTLLDALAPDRLPETTSGRISYLRHDLLTAQVKSPGRVHLLLDNGQSLSTPALVWAAGRTGQTDTASNCPDARRSTVRHGKKTVARGRAGHPYVELPPFVKLPPFVELPQSLHRDERSRLWCSAEQETSIRGIYAVGDLVSNLPSGRTPAAQAALIALSQQPALQG